MSVFSRGLADVHTAATLYKTPAKTAVLMCCDGKLSSFDCDDFIDELQHRLVHASLQAAVDCSQHTQRLDCSSVGLLLHPSAAFVRVSLKS